MLILDEIWYGNTTFETHTAGDAEYKKEIRKLVELSDSFTPLLSDEQRKSFDDLNDQQVSVAALGEKDAFIAGVRYGSKLILDVLLSS